MQHQQPYSISFLRWQSNHGQFDKPQIEPWKERSLSGILVTSESTRSKKTAFKTRTHWDEPASTYLIVDPKDTEGLDTNIFWSCMDYALVGAICVENSFEECVGFDNSWKWFENLP